MEISKLLTLIHNAPDTFDFKNRLSEYISSEMYKPYEDDSELRKNLSKFISVQDNVKLIEECYKILAIKPYDIEAHALIGQATRKIDKIKLSSVHNFIASNLLDLILKSGNGKDYNTAYKINFPEDEMAVFTFIQSYPQKRISHEKNGNVYDIYTMKKGCELFFDITIPFMTLAGEK